MNKQLVILITLLVFFQSCSFEGGDTGSKPVLKERPELLNRIINTEYDRYVMFKGDDCSSLKDVFAVRKETYLMDWKISVAKYNDWTVIRLDSIKNEGFEITTDFHGLASDFFGEPGEAIKFNETQEALAIAIDKKGKNSYLSYINKEIFESNEEGSCIMNAVFQDNEKVLVTACFDVVYAASEVGIPDYNQLLKQYNIDLNKLQGTDLKWESMSIKSR